MDCRLPGAGSFDSDESDVMPGFLLNSTRQRRPLNADDSRSECKIGCPCDSSCRSGYNPV